jgi:hypothetical protein
MSAYFRLVAALLLVAATPMVTAFTAIRPMSAATASPTIFVAALQMSPTAVPSSASAATPNLKTALKKPSKTLTVGVEYLRGSENCVSANELSILSMQLRKAKVSAIWCSNFVDAASFAKEQESAKGNFPGPCPVIYDGQQSFTLEEDVQAAIEAGVTAMAVGVDSIDTVVQASSSVKGGTVELIWKVVNTEDVQTVLAATENSAQAFWYQGDMEHIATVATVLPPSAFLLASVEPMQPDGKEISNGRELKKSGCVSILVQSACVGDAEDLEYTRFLVDGMTSKASSEFKFTGLTGSTNGHFGGIQANGSVKWRRVQ